MKYYHQTHEIKLGDDIDIIKLPYKPSIDVPVDTDVWAIAYTVDDESNRNRLRCEPTLGQIKKRSEKYNAHDFVPYNKQRTGFRKSGHVDINARMYADTYEEAVELYNELVEARINKLQTMLNEAKSDML